MRNEVNSWDISDIDKANLFGQYLSKIFTPHDIILNNNQNLTINQSLNAALSVSLPAKPTSPGEIDFIIKKLHKKKAPGYDQISNITAKNLPKKVIILLSYIYNAMFRLSYYPLTWKFFEIIIIPKPNKPPKSVTSYRPILYRVFFQLYPKCSKKSYLKGFSLWLPKQKLLQILQAKPFHHSPITSRSWYHFLVFRKKKNFVMPPFWTYLKRLTGSGTMISCLNLKNFSQRLTFY